MDYREENKQFTFFMFCQQNTLNSEVEFSMPVQANPSTAAQLPFIIDPKDGTVRLTNSLTADRVPNFYVVSFQLYILLL